MRKAIVWLRNSVLEVGLPTRSYPENYAITFDQSKQIFIKEINKNNGFWEINDNREREIWHPLHRIVQIEFKGE